MEKRCMDMWRQLDAARTPEERACGIPVMDMGLYQKDPQAWSICFVAGFPVHGFAILKNHGIPAAQVEAACDAVRALFARPWEELEEKYIVDPSRLRERGLCEYGRETHRVSPHGTERRGDMKAYMQFGREDLPPAEMQALGILPNVWPHDPPDFREKLTALEAGMGRVERAIHAALATGLGLGENHFLDKARHGDTIWRTNFYPALRDAPDTGGERSGMHTDGGLFTLLLSSGQPGLVVMPDAYDESTWLRPPVGARYMVVNAGKVLDRLTRGFIPATRHMVEKVRETGESRVSIPRFVWLSNAEKIESLDCPPPPVSSASRREITQGLLRDYPDGTTIGAYRRATLKGEALKP